MVMIASSRWIATSRITQTISRASMLCLMRGMWPYSKGVNVVNWPMGRLLMSYFASKYVRIVTRMPVCDATAGFVGYRREVLDAIDFDRLQMNGYGFQIEMKYTAWRLGYTIGEVSIIFIDRVEGTSKMSSGIFGEAFFGVLKLPFRTIKPKQ